ncbi:MAG: sodium ion-translocating decarboxylase subunit beta [Gammaproteobacteria bacterium]|nr:MAG: sodium ion-translocating decarboxylase subunit beta [Gammaproteobacteria bacterium]
MENFIRLWEGSGFYNMTFGQAAMIMVGLLLLYLAIKRGFEPLLLVPIGFGAVMSNIPSAGLAESAAHQAFHKVEVYEQRVVDQFLERNTGFKEISFDDLSNEAKIYDKGWGDEKNAEEAKGILELSASVRSIVKRIAAKELRSVKNAEERVFEKAVKACGSTLCDKIYNQIYENHSKEYAALQEIAKKSSFADGILYLFYSVGLVSGAFPLLIFMGVGAMTDFGPLLANPKTLLLGAAAQFGIFVTLIGAIALGFKGFEAAAIGIIGGADGPTAIYVTSKLAPHLLGAIAVAAYSYMALVPMIQPPIMKLLTTEEERKRKMDQLRPVSQTEKIMFPLVLLVLVGLFLPEAAPLLGMFCFGTLMRECGVVERLNQTTQNALINVVTIFLGLSVGSKLQAGQFLQFDTLKILVLGIVAFGIGTACGVLMAKLMHRLSKEDINPLIGSAGVSAVPMAARVSNKVGLEANPQNFLLMHAMGPNVAGVIGSAVAAGVLLKYFGS